MVIVTDRRVANLNPQCHSDSGDCCCDSEGVYCFQPIVPSLQNLFYFMSCCLIAVLCDMYVNAICLVLSQLIISFIQCSAGV